MAFQARWLKFNASRFRHRQQFGNAFLPAGNPLVVLDCKQYVRGLPSIRDKNWPPFRRSFRPARVLIELSARQFGNRYVGSSRVATWLHYAARRVLSRSSVGCITNFTNNTWPDCRLRPRRREDTVS